MKQTKKFWPLDYDVEDDIFDSPAWDLPGRSRRTRHPKRKPASRVR
jgi:hypothetical protein